MKMTLPKSADRLGRVIASANPPEGQVRLSLLNGFELTGDGGEIHVTMSAQRLLAFLALNDRAVGRLFVAGSLWPDSTEDHASANLRSALWRLHSTGWDLVLATRSWMKLAPAIRIDVRDMGQQATRLINGSGMRYPGDFVIESLASDLLPGWYDDWVLNERERLRQLRLHALEALCDTLTSLRRFGQAIEAGLAAISADPLRESAWRMLIKAHVAEGNLGEAARLYRSFQRRAAEELGVVPSWELENLLRPQPLPFTPEA